MSAEDLFVGFGLTLVPAVGCQILAASLQLPAIIVLLPVGFEAGHFVSAMNPEKTLGPALSPLVALAVAIILFDGGLDLVSHEIRRSQSTGGASLAVLGAPLTWAGAGLLALTLLGLSGRASVMLGAIVPTRRARVSTTPHRSVEEGPALPVPRGAAHVADAAEGHGVGGGRAARAVRLVSWAHDLGTKAWPRTLRRVRLDPGRKLVPGTPNAGVTGCGPAGPGSGPSATRSES